MVIYQIDIDGTIGGWDYSKDYVKNRLNENKGKSVLMRMNSSGGSLTHGLAMSDRIQEHGDVTAHLMGFNASAATLAVLKAKKVCMASNGFYLIHKVMSPVDIWEDLNADQMEALISELIADKLENDKIDQVLAQMYADKTGKTMQEMLDLMKIGGWMTANEALDWGFVDEILPTAEKINMAAMKEKLNAFGLTSKRINKEDLFTTKNNFKMKKQFDKVNAVIGVDKLESDKDGVFLNEEQIEKIDSRIGILENKVEAVKTNLTKSKEAVTSAEADIVLKDAEIAELKLQVENLNKGAGDKTNTVAIEVDGVVTNVKVLSREEGEKGAKELAAFL